jgi:hypothetical protein
VPKGPTPAPADQRSPPLSVAWRRASPGSLAPARNAALEAERYRAPVSQFVGDGVSESGGTRMVVFSWDGGRDVGARPTEVPDFTEPTSAQKTARPSTSTAYIPTIRLTIAFTTAGALGRVSALATDHSSAVDPSRDQRIGPALRVLGRQS